MYLCGACIILYVSFTNKILIPHEEHGPKEWQINLPEGSNDYLILGLEQVVLLYFSTGSQWINVKNIKEDTYRYYSE